LTGTSYGRPRRLAKSGVRPQLEYFGQRHDSGRVILLPN